MVVGPAMLEQHVSVARASWVSRWPDEMAEADGAGTPSNVEIVVIAEKAERVRAAKARGTREAGAGPV